MRVVSAVKNFLGMGEDASPAEVLEKQDVTGFFAGEPGRRSVTSALDDSLASLGRLTLLQLEPVVLRLRHVGKSYPIAGSDERVIALKDINLAEIEDPSDTTSTPNPLRGDPPAMLGPVRRGEFVIIRGPSGGGKTTLLNIIGSIDSCTEGSIELNGCLIDKNTKESVLADLRLRTLGFVFQTFNLIATMTAAENVELPMTLLGKLSSKAMRLRSRQLLTLVGLRNRINHLPSELSGGEQQRVTIARSLANNPSLLLLDEPTGDLDTANTIEVMDLLMRLNRRTKTTCIMVTHNPDIECYADRILYVNDGRFVKEAYNTLPQCLELNAYAKYIAAKEQELTGVAHIGVAAELRPMENLEGLALNPNIGMKSAVASDSTPSHVGGHESEGRPCEEPGFTTYPGELRPPGKLSDTGAASLPPPAYPPVSSAATSIAPKNSGASLRRAREETPTAGASVTAPSIPLLQREDREANTSR